jgi:hypothetical protein
VRVLSLPLGRPLDRVEDHPALDVNALARAGFLEPGTRTWRGEDDEWEPFGLTLVTRGDLVEFHFGGVRLGATVLTSTPCHFGGRRPWFLCPGCEEPVGNLHFVDLRPRCRTCWDLRYESQLEDELHRGLRRARRIRRQLGGDERLIAPFPPKPPKMRWAKYDALRRETHAAEQAYLDAQQSYTAKLLERLGLEGLWAESA